MQAQDPGGSRDVPVAVRQHPVDVLPLRPGEAGRLILHCLGAQRRGVSALKGGQGGMLWGLSVKDGRKRHGLSLDALPVWDGMAVANGGLFVATKDGMVTRFGK